MRLNAFFTKTGGSPSKSPSKATATATTIGKAEGDSEGAIAKDELIENARTDYAQDFPDFFLLSHTTLAPPHRFQRDGEASAHIRQKLDAMLTNKESAPPLPRPFRPSEVFNMIPYRRRIGRRQISVKEIYEKIQAHSEINDNCEGTKSQSDPKDLLKQISMKTLKFGEDYRPPYQGTFTRPVPEATIMKLCRNPFSRSMPETNYNYDSEAEYEEPDDGDCDDEEEEEIEDEEDDMAEFLDDEDDALANGARSHLVGDMEPLCTGIRWQEDSQSDPELQCYRMEIISGES